MGGLVSPVAPVPLADLGRVHFTGIGGAGMSGIARIMLARGVKVSGSDAVASDLLTALAGLGADVHVGHAAENIDGADTLVVSTAIRGDNPELAQARRRGLRILHRAAALASVMLGRRGVAVAGTHGKTTTTSMITTALRHCGADPGYVIGGILTETGLGAEDGTGEVFVAEADESDGSFLMLSPEVAVVTCVAADHLDNYSSPAEIEDAFAAFARRITPGRVLIAGADDPGARRRMEPKGAAGGVTVLDSYAHHPTELAADLRAAREIAPGGRVIAVFQPHLFSRTRIFAGQFGAALGLADEVFVLDVYAAREDPEPGVTGELVARAVPGGRAVFLPDRAATPGAVADVARPGDLILTMGAGDVTALGPLIVAALGARAGAPG